MVGYQPTQIRWPENETEFEKKVGILFREVLSDPSIRRLGRRGQKQYGIDLVGRREGASKRIVGIQCKLKGRGKGLSEDEVKREFSKALKFKPKILEYFIVTTAPNDTDLDSLALTLAQRQAKKGREVKLEIWGEGTLSERINEYDAAKNAFDPGFSPSIQRQQQQLDTVIAGQANITSAVAAVRAGLEQAPQEVARLPRAFADREIRQLIDRALKRRGFRESNPQSEFAQIGDRVVAGDLTLGSAPLRVEALQRAARAHADPTTIERARHFIEQARRIDASIDTTLYEAIEKDAEGRTDEALQDLRDRNDPVFKTALYNTLSKRRGIKAALAWFQQSGLGILDFNPAGATNILIQLIEDTQYDSALKLAKSLNAEYLGAAPALYFVRASLTLASALPTDQKRLIFAGLPADTRVLRLASDAEGRVAIRTARDDFQALIPKISDLELPRTLEYVRELSLWTQLEDPETRQKAIEVVTAELADPSKTLQRVRLALSYDIPFNRDALWRHLRSRHEIGNWSDDERFVAFLLAVHGENESALADFFEEYRDEIFTWTVIDPALLAAMEVEALARSGRLEDARRRLAEHSGQRLTPERVADLDRLLTSIEGDDEVEQIRRRYEASNNLQDLMALMEAAGRKGDRRLFANIAPKLALETRDVKDFGRALSALFGESRYADLLKLTEQLPELYSQDDYFASLGAWSLFHVGRVLEARKIARDLYETRNEPNDRELAINTSIETGDWGYLQSILTREVSRIDSLDAKSLVRLARLALEVGSPYVNSFRDGAIRVAPSDPQVYLAAYTLSVERGDEYQSSQAHEWLEKAAGLSGPEGPVQKMPLKDIAEKASGWNAHVSKIDETLREGKVPLSLGATVLRRQPMEFILGQALRNEDYSDPRYQSPILAFSGVRPALIIGDDIKNVAIDLTAIFTLEGLGVLDKTIEMLEDIFISPATLSTLFIERQFLRFHQPSQRAKAERIAGLISRGKLKILPSETLSDPPGSSELDDELVSLLSRAERDKAVVIRSAPVFKKGTYLEQPADLSQVAQVLADTHAVLSFLRGRVNAATESSARSYLRSVDSGWQNCPPITASSILYLDDLTVTYLDYVGLLEPLTQHVDAVYVLAEVGERANALLSYSGLSEQLLNFVERIRSVMSAGLEKGKVHFTGRRPLDSADDGDDDTKSGPPMPVMDIMSNLAGLGGVICDDRFLNKDQFWSGQDMRVPTITSLDVLGTLRARKSLSSEEYDLARHRLRARGYYAIGLEPRELLIHLERAERLNGRIVETPELRGIRESISLGRRSHVLLASELPWFLAVRSAFTLAIRELWNGSDEISKILPAADWLIAFVPDPLEWCLDPDDQLEWAAACQNTVMQNALLICNFPNNEDRRSKYADWIAERLVKPLAFSQSWLWEMTLGLVKVYVKQMVDAK